MHLLHWIRDNQDFNYTKINNMNPLYLIINKIYGYVKESNASEDLTPIPTDESKDTLKNMKNCGVKSDI